MRILQLLSHDRIDSGGSIQALLLGRELARRGHDVVLGVAAADSATERDTRARVEAAGCAFESVHLRGLRGALAGRKSLTRLLARGFDLVHLHRESALRRFLAASPGPSGPVAIANVGSSTVPVGAQAAGLRSPRIARIVVVASALGAMLEDKVKVAPAKIATVLGAFDEERFRPDVEPLDRERDLGVPRGAPLVGLVANLDKKKGAGNFLRAALVVMAKRDDAWFVCAGGGDVAAYRRRCAREFSPALERRLVTLGFRDDVARLMATLDVSVSASTRGEGLSGAMRESLAMGTPVVCTDVGGNRELVRHGETGLLVPPRDPAALAAAILETLADPVAARERAERGRVEVRARLTSRARAAAVESVYLEALAERGIRDVAASAGDREGEQAGTSAPRAAETAVPQAKRDPRATVRS